MSREYSVTVVQMPLGNSMVIFPNGHSEVVRTEDFGPWIQRRVNKIGASCLGFEAAVRVYIPGIQNAALMILRPEKKEVAE